MTTNIFPSYILEPKKTIESITWFLNPIEEPPQKFLQLQNKNSKTSVYLDLLTKEGFLVESTNLESLISNKNAIDEQIFNNENFNIIFSLANDEINENFEVIIQKVHSLLKPSSYFIFEVKLGEIKSDLETMFSNIFESVNFLSPWSDLSTNPFSPFDSNKSNYCWVVALSKNSDYDPGEWIETM